MTVLNCKWPLNYSVSSKCAYIVCMYSEAMLGGCIHIGPHGSTLKVILGHGAVLVEVHVGRWYSE